MGRSEDRNRSARHVVTLDALRGLAAVVVMIYHQGFWTGIYFFGHPVLAVDFFFALSGFVIARAYEARLHNELSFARFARARVIRLYPLIVFATMLAGAAALTNVRPDGLPITAGTVWLLIPFSALALPSPPLLSSDTYPLNPPEWSLFFEIVANAAYAAGLYRLSNRMLMLLIISLGIAFAVIARSRGMAVGFVWSGFGYAFIRVAFPFLIGVWINRLNVEQTLPIIPGLPFILAILLTVTLWGPNLSSRDWIYWIVAIAIIFPIIILIAVCAKNSEVGRLAQFSAQISYPIYLIHYPIFMFIMPILLQILSPLHAMFVSGAVVIWLAWVVSSMDTRVRRRLANWWS